MKHLICISIALLIGFSSCSSKKPIYEQTVNFPNYQWNRFNILEFSPEIKKTKKTYDFAVILTYQEGYPYETLPINTVLTYPNGQKNILRRVILIKNEQGYLGNKEGKLRRIETIIHTGKKFSEVGKYTFTVQQLTQYYDLENIASIRCKVSPSIPKKRTS